MGVLLTTPTIDKELLADGDRREDAWDRARGDDRIDGWSIAQDGLGAGVDIEGDEAQRHRGVRQVVELDVPFDYPAQPMGWNEMVSVPREATHDRPQADREGVRALDTAPGPGELPCRLGRLRTRRDERGVECADRGPHEQVGGHTTLVEGPQHAHLKRAQARAA
jgi:hypothetical protein